MISTFKDLEKEKPKTNDNAVPIELLPSSKRPNTEDFLTFLCFRGTSILPPSLDFFNTATSTNTNEEHQPETPDTKHISTENLGECSTSTSAGQPTDRPFVAFGVRKRADPTFVNKQMDRKRRHALTVQALRRKYQNQRLAKIRAIAVSKINSGNSELVKDIQKPKKTLNKVAVAVPKKVVVARLPPAQKKALNTKRNMGLRSGGKIVPQIIPVKRRVVKKVQSKPKNQDTSSEFSSDDNQPLVKRVKARRKVLKRVIIPSKVVTNKLKSVSNARCTRSNAQSGESSSQRPSRKTKEAAALYMEMLGRKLSVPENEVDEDTMSIDSFPELPNVKRAVQRENEIKAQNKNNSPEHLPKTRNKNKEEIKPTGKLIPLNSKKLKKLQVCKVEIRERPKRFLSKPNVHRVERVQRQIVTREQQSPSFKKLQRCVKTTLIKKTCIVKRKVVVENKIVDPVEVKSDSGDSDKTQFVLEPKVKKPAKMEKKPSPAPEFIKKVRLLLS